MHRTTVAAAAALLLAGTAARATTCSLTIEGDDRMRYSVQTLAAPRDCTQIELTLVHAGQLDAKVMGHDWVLARTADMPGIVNAGLAAGFGRGFLPEHDRRIIAATRVVGGGERATVSFSTTALEEGASYSFFCTAPGHATVMRGRFVFGGAG